MSAQVQQMSAQAQELAATADQLRTLVARFSLPAAQPAPTEPAHATRPALRRVA
jgi:outer membrane murein-binding lipoprotein Lpp